MLNKDVLFEDILNSWINEINSNPDSDMNSFIKAYMLSSDDEYSLSNILIDVVHLKKRVQVDIPIEYKNRLMSNILEKYDKQYGSKKQNKTLSEGIKKLLLHRQPQVQLSYREKENRLSDKDQINIDKFLKELEGGG